MDYETVLTFWFKELQPSQWWHSDPQLDARIKEQFAAVYSQASLGELYHWRERSRGRLAEIIILDQFSRNMFRGDAQAYACDSMALALSQEAISLGVDKELTDIERSFMYMPFMHSESALIHETAVDLFASLGIESSIRSEQQHFATIKRFGRYPHRNQVLWRESTKEEMAYLEHPDAHF